MLMILRSLHLPLAVLVLLGGQPIEAQQHRAEVEQRLSQTQGRERLTLLTQLIEEFKKTDPKQGLSLAKEALDLARASGNGKDEVDALNQLADMWEASGNPGEGLRLAQQSQVLAEREKYLPGLGKSYHLQAIMQESLASFETSLELAHRALKIEESSGDLQHIAASWNLIGILNLRMKQYEQAAQAWERTLSLYQQIQDKGREADTLSNLGILYRRRRQFPKALEYYQRAMKLRRELPEGKDLGDITINMGSVYYELGELARAEECYQQALALREATGDKRAVAIITANLAEVYRDMKRFEKGRPYLDRARALCEEISNRDMLADCYLLESDYAMAKGDHRSALEWHRKFYQEKDAIFTRESASRMAEIQGRYEADKKQKEIELLRKDQAVQRTTQHLYMVVLAGLGLLAAVLLRLYRIKTKAQKQISQKNRDLETLDGIVQSINRHRSLKELSGDLLDQGRSLVPQADSIALFLLESDRATFRLEAFRGVNPEEEARFIGLRLSFQDAVTRYTQGSELEHGMFLIGSPEPLSGASPLNIPVPAVMLVMSLEIDGSLEGFLILDHLSGSDGFDHSDVLRLVRLREHAISAISKARTIAQLQDLNEQKNQFMSIAAHDLRAPLNSIVLSAQMLEGETTLNDVRNAARYIKREGIEMSLLIGRFLDIQAIEAGQVKAKTTAFSLRTEALKILDRHSRRATEKHIRLEFVDCEGSLCTFADPCFTLEVLDNLLSNAIKFSPCGTQVNLRLEKLEDKVRFSVEDQGPGLSKDDLQKCFGRYAQLSAKPTAGEKSTGLGLSIVKHMVDSMGGRIWVESEFGQGASFRVELPAAHVEAIEPDTSSLPAEDATPRHFRGRVLLADDNASNRMVAEMILKNHGLFVKAVENGLEALEALDREHFDLVILDGNMPGMNGPATVAEIRIREQKESQGKKKRLPVVALTGLARTKDRQWLLQGGFDEVLPKPVELSPLRAVLARYLVAEDTLPSTPSSVTQASEQWPPLAEVLGGQLAFQEFLEAFLSDAEQRLAKLLKTLDTKDMDSLVNEAHNLKSNAKTLHFDELGNLCEDLEHHAPEMEATTLRAKIEHLPMLMDDVRKQCRNYMKT